VEFFLDPYPDWWYSFLHTCLGTCDDVFAGFRAATAIGILTLVIGVPAFIYGSVKGKAFLFSLVLFQDGIFGPAFMLPGAIEAPIYGNGGPQGIGSNVIGGNLYFFGMMYYSCLNSGNFTVSLIFLRILEAASMAATEVASVVVTVVAVAASAAAEAAEVASNRDPPRALSRSLSSRTLARAR